MSCPSRRSVLGGLTALATPVMPATAGVTMNPDAALIEACCRYLELERIMADPAHPEHALDCDKMSEWPEYEALGEALNDAEPQTAVGWAALAGVALLCDTAIDDAPWNDGEESRIAWKVLAHLAGPAVVLEEVRRVEARARRGEAAWQRIIAEAAAHPASEPYKDKSTPQQTIEGARRMIATCEQMIRDAEAELASRAVAT